MTYQRPGIYINESLLPAAINTEGTADAAGAAIGVFAQGPTAVTRVTSWYDFVRTFGGYDAAYPATFGIGSFFKNGGSELYVRRVVHSDAAKATATLVEEGDTPEVATIEAVSFGTEGNNLRIQLERVGTTSYHNLSVYKEGTANNSGTLAGDTLLERYTNVVFDAPTSGDFVETVVNLNSKYITISVVADNTALPSLAILPLTGGLDGTTPVAGDYLGTSNSVLAEFEILNRPLVVFVPEVIAQLGATDGQTVLDEVVGWAGLNNAFVVIDTDQALDGTAPNLTVAQALSYAAGFQESSHAAVYYPNVYISDPVGRSNASLRKIGPAGAVAGLYLSTDREVGPFKAPAGVGAQLRGVVALEKAFTSAELDSLNASTAPVNAIRNLPGAGVVVMGARTLLQDGTANKYVNMRRSLIYIKEQLSDITTFALFENNDERLWAKLRTSVASFLNDYRNQGGLRGTTPQQAFYVKCDAENNSTNAIANGEVHIEVGVALQYPAEFVVINLSQTTGV
jgi:phage tail sheath protein FI